MPYSKQATASTHGRFRVPTNNKETGQWVAKYITFVEDERGNATDYLTTHLCLASDEAGAKAEVFEAIMQEVDYEKYASEGFYDMCDADGLKTDGRLHVSIGSISFAWYKKLEG